MTTIKDLCNKVLFSEVQRALNYHYPEDKNNYLSVFEFLKSAIPKETFPEKLQLTVWKDDEEYYQIDTNDGYGISFRLWENLANLEILELTLTNNLSAEIIAHFIWEITFYGNQKETETIFIEIQDNMKKFKIKEIIK